MDNKSEMMKMFLDSYTVGVYGISRRDALDKEICVGCKEPVDFNWPEPVYEKEYRLSGLCTDCQDMVFGGGDE